MGYIINYYWNGKPRSVEETQKRFPDLSRGSEDQSHDARCDTYRSAGNPCSCFDEHGLRLTATDGTQIERRYA